MSIFSNRKQISVLAQHGRVIVKMGWTTVRFETRNGEEVKKLDNFIQSLTKCRNLSLKSNLKIVKK